MTKTDYHLVQANVSHARAELEDPVMKDFMDRVDEIDQLAQEWPGFVSQPTLPDEGFVYTEPMLLNVSIWNSVDHLRDFTYASRHFELLERRSEWFVQSEQPNYVLFWIPAGTLPTEQQIRQRLDHLRDHGPTPRAFTFDQPYTADEMLAFEGE